MDTCFVVMGFHKKTDFATGRTLDLDKAYRNIIKPTVEECGLRCVRGDEIPHAGVIDVPMYQQLLSADLVVADLSSCNANALYELGVRHALRPNTTVVIADKKLTYPFDVNHTTILGYEWTGEGIDYDEVVAFRGKLKEIILAVRALPQCDSPVYTYLPGLQPPVLAAPARAAAVPAPATPPPGAPGPAPAAAVPDARPAVESLLALAESDIRQNRFLEARGKLQAAVALKPADAPRTLNDAYVVQRLAFATYKSKAPTPLEALHEAAQVLEGLEPRASNDAETLGLWGAVHKRLWELTGDRAALDAAVRSYERGFFLRQDYYNGINLAFLLDARASTSGPADAVADHVGALRIRRQVVAICDGLLAQKGPSAGAFTNRETSARETAYWIHATLAEAWLGLGDRARAAEWLARARVMGVDPWMEESTREQLAKLAALLQESPLRYLKDDS